MGRPARFRFVLLVALSATALVADGCSGLSGDKKSSTTPSSSSSSTTVTVMQVRLSGTTSLTARNQTTQLSATATLSDGSTRSVTQDADWTTSNTTVATVSGGLVTAREVGDADIGATYRGAAGSAPVQVRYCSLSFGSTGCSGMGPTSSACPTAAMPSGPT